MALSHAQNQKTKKKTKQNIIPPFARGSLEVALEASERPLSDL